MRSNVHLDKLPAEVGQAIADGRADDELAERHIARAREIVRLPDGRVRFVVDRHPHIAGRQSVGRPSPAYDNLRVTYEWNPDPAEVTRVSEEAGKPDVDIEAFAAETIDEMSECGPREPELAQCETRGAAAVVAATIARSIEWVDDSLEERLSPVQRRDYIAACIRRYERLLMTWWSEEREDREHSE